SGIINLLNPNDHSSRPRFDGVIWFYPNEVADFMWANAPPVNRSFTYQKVTAPEECLELLQQNESDVAIGAVRYPIDDIERIFPFGSIIVLILHSNVFLQLDAHRICYCQETGSDQFLQRPIGPETNH